MKPASLQFSIIKTIIYITIQQFSVNMIILLDNIFIGQFSELALSHSIAVSKVFTIVTAGFLGVLAGCGVYLSQFYGSKDDTNMQYTFVVSLFISGLLIVPIAIFSLIWPDVLVGLVINDTNIIEYGMTYMAIYSLSLIPYFVSNNIMNALRCIGQTKVPLIICGISVFTNGFSYLFFFKQYGYDGVALAILFSRVIEMLLLGFVVHHNPYAFKIHRIHLKVPMPFIKKIAYTTIPLMINEIVWGMGIALMFKGFALRGSKDIAALNVASTANDLFRVLSQGFGAATLLYVSSNLGASALEKAWNISRTLIKYAWIGSIMVAITMGVLAYPYITFYNMESGVQTQAWGLLMIYALIYPFTIVNAQCYFILRCGGDTKSTVLVDSGYMWAIQVPLVLICAYCSNMNIIGILIISECTHILKYFFARILVNKKRWLVNLTT